MASETVSVPVGSVVERLDAWSDLPVALLERQLLVAGPGVAGPFLMIRRGHVGRLSGPRDLARELS